MNGGRGRRDDAPNLGNEHRSGDEGSAERGNQWSKEDALADLRARILKVDRELLRLVAERRDLVLSVGRAKEELGLPVLDPAREARVIRQAAEEARGMGLDEEMVRDVLWRVIASARDEQEGRTYWGPPPRPTESGDNDSFGPEDSEGGS